MKFVATCEFCSAEYRTSSTGSKIGHYCSYCCKGAANRRKRQIVIEQEYGLPIKELLLQLYHVDGLGIKAIARELSMSDHTLWTWFEDLGIERRNRSAAVTMQWHGADKRRDAQSQRTSKQMRQRVKATDYQPPSKRPDVAKKISQAKMGPGNAMYGKFCEQNPNWRGGKITYRGRGWRGIRAQILRRDNFTCAKCTKQFSRLDLDVHHITPYRDTQDNSPENLMTLCKWCHMIVEYHSETLTPQRAINCNGIEYAAAGH